MTPSEALIAQIATALATTVPLAQATALNRVGLVMAPFTPSPTTLYADLVFATFTGATPKTVASGDQGAAQDPVTNQQQITVVEPAGGWRWVTTDDVNLPQTIYGFALYDSTSPETLIGSGLLPEAITLTDAAQEINVGTVKYTLVLSPLS